MLSVKWRVQHESCGRGHFVQGMPKDPRERQWVDISASSEEECIIQVELTRNCVNSGKVIMAEHLQQ